MTTIAEKLTSLIGIKQDLYTAIEDRGVPMSGIPFQDYASCVAMIASGPINQIPDSFLYGTWDIDTYRDLRDGPNWADGLLIDYEAILPTDQVVEGVYRVNRGTTNYIALNATSTVELLDGQNNPIPVFWVDWGDGQPHVGGLSGATLFKNYDFDTLIAAGIADESDGFYGQRIEVRFKLYAAAGAQLDTISFQIDPDRIAHPSVTCNVSKMAVNGPYLTRLELSPKMDKGIYNFDQLQEFWLGSNQITSMRGMFTGCNKLIKVVKLETNSCTDMSYMFNGCEALETIPEINDDNVVNYEAMFLDTPTLVTTPPMSFRKAVNLTMMFGNSGVIALPPCTTFGADLNPFPTDMQYLYNMFSGCKRLRYIPTYDFQKVLGASGLYAECTGIVSPTTAYPLTFPNADTLNVMFAGCSNLSGLVTVEAPVAIAIDYLFTGCKKLKMVSVNAPMAASMDNVFANCHTLEYVTLYGFDPAPLRSFATFDNCTSLHTLEVLSPIGGPVPPVLSRLPFFGPLRTSSLLALFAQAPNWVDPLTGQDNVIDLSNLFNLTLAQADINAIQAKGYLVTLP